MTAYASFGTLLAMDDGGGVTFTTVAGCRDIRGPKTTVDMEDTTNHGSSGGWEEFVPSIKHSGEVTVDILYDPNDATHDGNTGLLYVVTNRLLRNWRILMVTNAARRWNFAGYVSAFETAFPLKGVQTVALTIKVSGPPSIS